MTDLDLLKAIKKFGQNDRYLNKETQEPKLPKPCGCEKPMAVTEPGEATHCLKCGRDVVA